MKPSVRSSIGLGILYWLTQIASLLIVFPAFFIYGYVTKQPVDFEQAMPMLVTTMVSYVFLIAFLLYKGHLHDCPVPAGSDRTDCRAGRPVLLPEVHPGHHETGI